MTTGLDLSTGFGLSIGSGLGLINAAICLYIGSFGSGLGLTVGCISFFGFVSVANTVLASIPASLEAYTT